VSPDRALLIAALAFAGMLTGCSARGTGEFLVPAGRYDQAFVAARETLRDFRFTPERIDAQAGIITTRSKPTAGLATPWDAEQSTPGDEVGDWLHRRTRSVRIEFDPAAPGDAPAHVRVTLARVAGAAPRVSSKAVSLETYPVNPRDALRGIGAGQPSPLRRDTILEARLARAIERRLTRDPRPPAGDRAPPPPTPPGSSPPASGAGS
jgi:hypothetical protein